MQTSRKSFSLIEFVIAMSIFFTAITSIYVVNANGWKQIQANYEAEAARQLVEGYLEQLPLKFSTLAEGENVVELNSSIAQKLEKVQLVQKVQTESNGNKKIEIRFTWKPTGSPALKLIEYSTLLTPSSQGDLK